MEYQASRRRAEVLSWDGRGNSVVRCAGGVVHLRYGTAVLHFSPEGFWRFALELREGFAGREASESLTIGLGPMALCVEKQEVAAFLRLVEEAVCRLVYQAQRPEGRNQEIGREQPVQQKEGTV